MEQYLPILLLLGVLYTYHRSESTYSVTVSGPGPGDENDVTRYRD